MTDPDRLLDGGGASLSVTLLRAGRDDAPSERLLDDTLVALGVGAAVVATGAAASTLAAGSSVTALKAGGTTSLATLALKWLGVGAVGGALTVGAAAGVEHSMSPAPKAPVAAPVREVVSDLGPTKPEIPAIPGTAVAQPEAAAPAPALPATSASAPRKKLTEPSIAEETAAVDQARRELASGNAQQALATLDQYDRRPGLHRLQQEALLLRMDALARSGNSAAARIIAKSLLDQSPNGPHAARARQVLDGPSQKK